MGEFHDAFRLFSISSSIDELIYEWTRDLRIAPNAMTAQPFCDPPRPVPDLSIAIMMRRVESELGAPFYRKDVG